MEQFISWFTVMVLRFESSSAVGLLRPEDVGRSGETGYSKEKLRSCAMSLEDYTTTSSSIGLPMRIFCVRSDHSCADVGFETTRQ